MNRLKMIVSLALIAGAVGAIVYQIGPQPDRTPVDVTQSQSPASFPAAASEPVSEQRIVAEGPAPAGVWGRNPFMSTEEIRANVRSQLDPQAGVSGTEEVEAIVVEPPPVPAYALSAILIGPNGKFAVINNRVLREGDLIGHERIKEIRNRAVVLESGNATHELTLRSLGAGFEPVPSGVNP